MSDKEARCDGSGFVPHPNSASGYVWCFSSSGCHSPHTVNRIDSYRAEPLAIALATIRERANKVFQMGDAETRRALQDIYAFASAAIKSYEVLPPKNPKP